MDEAVQNDKWRGFLTESLGTLVFKKGNQKVVDIFRKIRIKWYH